MTKKTMLAILRYIKLPRGTLLSDGTTYRLGKKDFPPRKFMPELGYFEKLLVLSDGNNNVVGGVLFYGSYDIQVIIRPKYRNMGYMSAIHKNGILKGECYPKQQLSLECDEIDTLDDFLKRRHLLQMAGLKVRNLSDVYWSLFLRRRIDCTEEEFLKTYADIAWVDSRKN